MNMDCICARDESFRYATSKAGRFFKRVQSLFWRKYPAQEIATLLSHPATPFAVFLSSFHSLSLSLSLSPSVSLFKYNNKNISTISISLSTLQIITLFWYTTVRYSYQWGIAWGLKAGDGLWNSSI